MAYDDGLWQRLTSVLERQPDLRAKRMFGCIGYLHHGHLAVGVHEADLLVRVGAVDYAAALAAAHVRPFAPLAGKPMTGWVLVSPEGLLHDAELLAWAQRALAVTAALPPK
ncbi:MAG: TfoX/Sxy family protein [Fimbriimonadaceae bacterium]|nr:TfoX/Sxy family protein [Fimbriimonadaceae bacterium]